MLLHPCTKMVAPVEFENCSYVFFYLLFSHQLLDVLLPFIGVGLKSKSVTVSPQGICVNPVITSAASSLGVQPFKAEVEYISPSAGSELGDRIHITVAVPHQDGMLPIISTLPIHNIDYLITQPSFSQQHLCSSLPTATPGSNLQHDFLGSTAQSARVEETRTDAGRQLYYHLDKSSCLWKFEAWYSLPELVDRCGGRLIHNFDVDQASRSFVTVYLPLYVSYVFAKAPTGWASLDHHTRLEASFYYQNSQFSPAVNALGPSTGRVEILRIGISEEGRMVVQLRTQAHFTGQSDWLLWCSLSAGLL